MNREDRFFFIDNEIRSKNLQQEFKFQVQQLQQQDTNRFNDVLERWEYAYEKVVLNNNS